MNNNWYNLVCSQVGGDFIIERCLVKIKEWNKGTIIYGDEDPEKYSRQTFEAKIEPYGSGDKVRIIPVNKNSEPIVKERTNSNVIVRVLNSGETIEGVGDEGFVALSLAVDRAAKLAEMGREKAREENRKEEEAKSSLFTAEETEVPRKNNYNYQSL